MKPMNRIEFVRTLRNSIPMRYDPSKASTPVMFLTGSPEAERIKRAKEAGVKGYIVKPFDGAVIQEKPTNVCQR